MLGLKVVALISGGKDSLFSILHCIANGHDVVALANLHPPLRTEQGAVDDMDSFMYQTIGHALIPLYGQALALPLYRQEIVGSAVDQRKSYGHDQTQPHADETESLVPLLLKVKGAHPEVNAVSTGAILSDYQRTRVESVAIRLGLTPLSYLWRWPTLPPQSQHSLLEDMAAVGQDSRIVKVASGGLDDSFLWQNVADRRTMARLNKASERFGSRGDGAVLGEGGEYETLAIQGPAPLWKGRIAVGDEDRQIVKGEAGSFSLRLAASHVSFENSALGSIDNLRIPPVLDQHMERILADLLSTRTPPAGDRAPEVTTRATTPYNDLMATREDGDVLLHPYRTGAGADAAVQMRSIMEALAIELKGLIPGAGLSAIAYTSIILRDIADFAPVNAVYGGYFTEPNPPARVTIACADVLPHNSAVMLGVTSLRKLSSGGNEVRKGLHVQSRSYWAPANIGPYSQAVSIPTGIGEGADVAQVVYVAGQIPLEPASMVLHHEQDKDHQSAFAHQAVLALQHMLRMGDAMEVSRWVAAIVFIAVSPSDDATALGKMARQAWDGLHACRQGSEPMSEQDEDDAFDVWNIRHGQGHTIRNQNSRSGLHGQRQLGKPPPLWVVRVDSLPRAASIEWVGYGTTTPDDQAVFTIRHLEYLLQVFRHRII